jgi:geranylgeranyl diphosphate synthase type I
MDLHPLLAQIESGLQDQVARLDQGPIRPFHEMLAYHMGWTGEGAGPSAQGKRIRPLLVLLCTAASGGTWEHSLPAATAVELVHNFSLVHDDIQDRSELRRGRRTVWAAWGAPVAINVGDALFVIANQSMLELERNHPAAKVVRAAELLNRACLDLTRGQFLDMSYTGRADLNVDDYWPMIRGKTAALLSASCGLGALLGGAAPERSESLRAFGENLGLAFQVQDDILGIWGDEHATGKSAATDLLEGKNSLPILFGLGRDAGFARLWRRGRLRPEEVETAAELLRQEGALAFAREQAAALTARSLQDLEAAQPSGPAADALRDLAGRLLGRAH